MAEAASPALPYFDLVVEGGPWHGATARCLIAEDGKPPARISVDDATGKVVDGEGDVIGQCVLPAEA